MQSLYGEKCSPIGEIDLILVESCRPGQLCFERTLKWLREVNNFLITFFIT